MIKLNFGQYIGRLRALILLLALALAGATTIEFKAALALISENRQLLSQQINRVFEQSVSAQLQATPTHPQQVNENWQSLKHEFVLWYDGQQAFPKKLKEKESLHPLWQLYADIDTSNSNERVQLLEQLSQALNAESKLEITKASQAFVSHLVNFHLSWQEELISRLRFLTIAEDVKWNPQLIDLLLFSGNDEFKPAAYYLFYAADNLSRPDFQKATSIIEQIVESSSMSKQVLRNFLLPLEQDYPRPISLGRWITDAGFTQTTKVYSQLLPANPKEYLDRFTKELFSLGLIESEDTVTFAATLPVELSANPIKVERQIWHQSTRKAWVALILKLCFLVLVSLLLLGVLKRYRKQAELELDALNAKAQFIQFVGHELKTPLASIRLMAETLYKRQEAGLPNKDYPQRIVDESDKLEFMVENLLSLQHLQSDQALILEPVSLAQVIDKELALLSNKTDKKVHFSSTNIGEAELLSSERYLPLVIRNLFDNAEKYTAQLQISLNCQFDDINKVLTIEDNGMGLQNIDDVFATFSQGPTSKQGFGLGLALCKVIMNKLGGDIEVERTGPTGTCWRLSFGDSND